MDFKIENLPDNLIRYHGGLERYLNHGIMPGSFLTAVLENKLMESYRAADDDSLRQIPSLIKYLYNHFPMAAWGSPERVAAWTQHVLGGILGDPSHRHGDSPDAQLTELQEGLQTGGEDS